MKYKKLLLSTVISLFIFTGNSFTAGTSSEDNVSKYEKLYKKGALLIKQGKKFVIDLADDFAPLGTPDDIKKFEKG